jgi:hypothetical protein
VSVKTSGRVWELDLPPNVKYVLLALADHADHDGDHAFPGEELLAAKTGYTERNVRRILRILEEMEIIYCTSEGRGAGYKSEYSIVTDNGNISEYFLKKEDKLSALKRAKRPLSRNQKEDKMSSLNRSNSGNKEDKFDTERNLQNKELLINRHEGVCEGNKRVVTPHTPQRKVSSNKKTLSRHSFETILAYTNRQKESGAKIDPVAVAMAREKDGKLDAVIDAELAKMAEQETAPRAAMPGQPDAGLLERFKLEISRRMYAQSFDTWFAPIADLSRTESAIFLRVPSEVFKNWITGNYNEQMGEALEELGLAGLKVEFVI